MRSRSFVVPAVVAVSLAVGGAVPVSAGSTPHARPGVCSPSAALLGFSDALDKTQVEGTAVAGLSALGLVRPGRALALVDNIGTTPARLVHLSVRPGHGGPAVSATGVTTLKRPDGTPYTGADFDGEGLVVERGGRSVLASSEVEPSIRRFRLDDGRQVAELPVPARLRVAPAGRAARNQTFEALAASRDGRTVYAGMEGPLAGDGDGMVRIVRYEGRPGGAYRPVAQYAYRTDPGLGLVELVVADGGLLALERGFTAGVGNTVRVHRVGIRGARDVSEVESLRDVPQAALPKEPLVDLADCPPSGATAKQPQPNPLLDNVEGMALGPGRVLYLVSDDNAGPAQTTRLYALVIR